MFKRIWNKLFSKYSSEDIEEIKKQLIIQLYGEYSFGDEVEEDTNHLFISIEQNIVFLYDNSNKKIVYKYFPTDKIYEGIEKGLITFKENNYDSR